MLMRTSVPGRHQDRSRPDSRGSYSQVSSQARSQTSCHAQLPILVVISAPEPPIWRNLAAQLGEQPCFRSELSARSPVATRGTPNLAEDRRGNVLNLGEIARKRSKGDILHQSMTVA